MFGGWGLLVVGVDVKAGVRGGWAQVFPMPEPSTTSQLPILMCPPILCTPRTRVPAWACSLAREPAAIAAFLRQLGGALRPAADAEVAALAALKGRMPGGVWQAWPFWAHAVAGPAWLWCALAAPLAGKYGGQSGHDMRKPRRLCDEALAPPDMVCSLTRRQQQPGGQRVGHRVPDAGGQGGGSAVGAGLAGQPVRVGHAEGGSASHSYLGPCARACGVNACIRRAGRVVKRDYAWLSHVPSLECFMGTGAWCGYSKLPQDLRPYLPPCHLCSYMALPSVLEGIKEVGGGRRRAGVVSLPCAACASCTAVHRWPASHNAKKADECPHRCLLVL